MGKQIDDNGQRGTVVVLFFPPSTFMMVEASPWPPDDLTRTIRAGHACFLQKCEVPDERGKPTPGIMLTAVGDLDLRADSWAGTRTPDPSELGLFEVHKKQQIAARSGLVLPGNLRGLPGGVH